MRGAAREGSKRARTDASSLTALPGLQFGFGLTAILCDVDVRPTPHDFFLKKIHSLLHGPPLAQLIEFCPKVNKLTDFKSRFPSLLCLQHHTSRKCRVTLCNICNLPTYAITSHRDRLE
jgi:hypothetical protein